MKKAYAIYAHFKNSNYEYTYMSIWKTLKTAKEKAEKLFKRENITRVIIRETPRGIYYNKAEEKTVWYFI